MTVARPRLLVGLAGRGRPGRASRRKASAGPPGAVVGRPRRWSGSRPEGAAGEVGRASRVHRDPDARSCWCPRGRSSRRGSGRRGELRDERPPSPFSVVSTAPAVVGKSVGAGSSRPRRPTPPSRPRSRSPARAAAPEVGRVGEHDRVDRQRTRAVVGPARRRPAPVDHVARATARRSPPIRWKATGRPRAASRPRAHEQTAAWGRGRPAGARKSSAIRRGRRRARGIEVVLEPALASP